MRAIAILLIFAIAAAVAYKTLAPIPARLWWRTLAVLASRRAGALRTSVLALEHDRPQLLYGQVYGAVGPGLWPRTTDGGRGASTKPGPAARTALPILVDNTGFAARTGSCVNQAQRNRPLQYSTCSKASYLLFSS